MTEQTPVEGDLLAPPAPVGTLTPARRNKNNESIEPQPKGKRHPSWDYGFTDATGAWFPEEQFSLDERKAITSVAKPKKSAKKKLTQAQSDLKALQNAQKVIKRARSGKGNVTVVVDRPKFHDEHVDKSTPLPTPAKAKRGRPRKDTPPASPPWPVEAAPPTGLQATLTEPSPDRPTSADVTVQLTGPYSWQVTTEMGSVTGMAELLASIKKIAAAANKEKMKKIAGIVGSMETLLKTLRAELES